jgi:uncharacterized surface protein with fasciclin (FAS1) repeats
LLIVLIHIYDKNAEIEIILFFGEGVRRKMGKTILLVAALLVLGGVFYSLFLQQPITQPEMESEAVVTEQEMAAEPGTIIEEASASGIFSTLLTAVDTAGLEETLSGEGPFTLFAPTDEAFAKIPAATLEALLADPEALTKVLTYHVVSGRVTAADVITMDQATSLNGQDIAIELVDEGVKLNDVAMVTQTDIFAANGVIHVIDAVLMPE